MAQTPDLTQQDVNFAFSLDGLSDISFYSGSYMTVYLFHDLLRRNKASPFADYYAPANAMNWRRILTAASNEYSMMLNTMETEFAYIEATLVDIRFLNIIRLIIVLALCLVGSKKCLI